MDTDQLMTCRDVAQYLNVHAATVRYAARQGALRGLRVGNRWRFRRKDVEAYLKTPAVPRINLPPLRAGASLVERTADQIARKINQKRRQDW